MTEPPACPAPETLRRLVLGHLPADDAASLERHVADCDACAQALGAINGEDEFVGAVRQGAATDSGADAAALIARLSDRLPDTARLLSRRPDELGSIGHYEILEVLGSGGMGVVYLARHAQLGRLVALKMLPAGEHLGGERAARLRREAGSVAGLQHPNVVQLYELGEHQGCPFLAMEYVAGGNLAERLAGRPLASHEASGLAEVLARAVHHAHERGVIHRDLKPSNVMLARQDGLPGEAAPQEGAARLGTPTPKITDFGLAKRLAEGQDTPTFATLSGQVMGTPGYVSPEQAAGREAGPQSDVYGLGAILYESLTGRPPFRAASALETLELVRTHDPIPPRQLEPSVPRDLETICLKCLHKDPARRYASALELAEDLGRFCRGEPIRARPPGWWGALWKWARRRPTTVALVVVLALAVVASLAGTSLHNARLRLALDRAEQNEQKALRHQREARGRYRIAHDTIDRMTGRLDGRGQLDAPTRRELRRVLLEDALAFHQAILTHADDPDPDMRLDVAVACARAGAIEYELGRNEAARRNLRLAVDLLDRLPSDSRGSTLARSCLVDCGHHLAALAGQVQEAERWSLLALRTQEGLAEESPDDAGVQDRLASAEHNLAAVYFSIGPADKCEAHYLRAIAIRLRLRREHPDDPGFATALAEDYQNLALLYATTGKPDRAAGAYEKAVGLLRPLARARPGDPRPHLALAAALSNWGPLLRDQGKIDDALAALDEAVTLSEAELKREPNDAAARTAAVNAHGNRAQTCERNGRPAAAAADYGRIAELVEEPRRTINLLLRAVSLAGAGDHAAATDLAARLAREAKDDDTRYNAATAYALMVRCARDTKALSAAKREEQADAYAGQAVALLKRLKAAGYFDRPDNADLLAKDAGLANLRGRPDFEALAGQRPK